MPRRRKSVIVHPTLGIPMLHIPNRHPFPSKTAAGKIEQISEPHKEMGWYRDKPGVLRPAAEYRGRHMFIMEEPTSSDKSDIHTHPPEINSRNKFGSHGYPSLGDLRNMLIKIHSSNLKFWHVASINKEGAVIGYFSMYPNPTFRKYAGSEILSAVEADLEGKSSASHVQQVVRWLMLFKKYGLRFRITPMSGYHFMKGRFVRIHRKK